MLCFLYLHLFKTGEPTLAEYVAFIDFFGLFIATINAIIMFYNTKPKAGDCDAPYEMSNSISRTIFIIFVVCGAIILCFRLINRNNASVIERTLTKFFIRWLLVLIVSIGIWNHTEYELNDDVIYAAFDVLPCAFRFLTVIKISRDTCKMFTGKYLGSKALHGGLSVFAKFWSYQWVVELSFVVALIIYYAIIFSAGSNKLNDLQVHISDVVVVFIDILSLLQLIGLVKRILLNEDEILKSSFNLYPKLSSRNAKENNSNVINQDDFTQYDSTCYLELSLFFDVVKMLMFSVFACAVSNGLPIAEWIIPNYVPHRIIHTLIYVIGLTTPMIYFTIHGILSYYFHALQSTTVRRYTVLVLFFFCLMGCSAVGAYRGCQKLVDLSNDGDLDFDTMNNTKSFFVYLAKSNAIPTAFAFGTIFLTSPGAARYCDSWHSLPLIFQIILSPMPWFSTLLMQEAHVACGTIFLTGGCYHAICWLIVYASKLIVHVPTGVFVAAITGLCMIAFGIKLLWPPGMELSVWTWEYIPVESWRNWVIGKVRELSRFVKDSKYGNYHVYLANFVFFLYCVHGTVNQWSGSKTTYYWYYPAVCYILLFFLHPTKSTYIAAKVQNSTTKVGNFDRSFKVRDKSCSSIRKTRGSSLTDVRLTLDWPTYDPNFADILDGKLYDGFCDVILVKLRSKSRHQLWNELETVHYYSCVDIKGKLDEIGDYVLEVSLMIQETRRKDGSSAALINPKNNCQEIEVLGFVKSNTVESIYAPAIIAFGYESGAAAFCSLLKQRRLRKFQYIKHVTDKTQRDNLRAQEIEFEDQLVIAEEEDDNFLSEHKKDFSSDIIQKVGVLTERKYDLSPPLEDYETIDIPPKRLSLKVRPRQTSLGSQYSSIGESPSKAAALPENEIYFLRSNGERYKIKTKQMLKVEKAHDHPDQGLVFATKNGSFHVAQGGQVLVEDSDNIEVPYTNDLLVVWTQFMKPMDDEDITTEILANAIEELAALQDYMYQQCGGASVGNKIVFVITNVPRIWTPVNERIGNVASDLIGSVDNYFHVTGDRLSFKEPRWRHLKKQKKGKTNNQVNSDVINVAGEFNALGVDENSDLYWESVYIDRLQDSQKMPLTPQKIVALHKVQASWVPLQTAIAHKFDIFQQDFRCRVISSLRWLNAQPGPGFTNFFVTGMQSDLDDLSNFKYQTLYDTVNRTIIEAQLSYLKNPCAFLKQELARDGDPVDAKPISCSVLYSGDYASSKLDQLKQVVEKVSLEQEEKDVPAFLCFNPDA